MEANVERAGPRPYPLARTPRSGKVGPMRYLCTLSLLLACPGLAPAQGSKVTFRDDRVVLADGKPFFPIGLYYCGEEFEDPSGKRLDWLKGYGFNTLGYYRWA